MVPSLFVFGTNATAPVLRETQKLPAVRIWAGCNWNECGNCVISKAMSASPSIFPTFAMIRVQIVRTSRSFSVLLSLADPEGQIVRRCVGLLRAIDLVTCVLSGEVSTFSAPNCCRRGTQLSLLYFLGATCGYPEASLKEVQSILNGGIQGEN